MVSLVETFQSELHISKRCLASTKKQDFEFGSLKTATHCLATPQASITPPSTPQPCPQRTAKYLSLHIPAALCLAWTFSSTIEFKLHCH